MKYIRIINAVWVVVFLSLLCRASFAQSVSSYHLTRDNGLPSNRIYGMITDRLGYLWLCTDKGVARYNGYGFKYFTMAEGLPTDDVWELIADRAGRVWLLSISDEIGYIKNDRYQAMPFREGKRSVYPNHVRRKGNGIIFFDAIHRQRVNYIFYDVINDSFQKHEVALDRFNSGLTFDKAQYRFIDGNGRVMFILDSTIYEHEYDGKTEGDLRYVSGSELQFWKFSKWFWYAINDGGVVVDETHPARNFMYFSSRDGKLYNWDLNLDKNDYISYVYVEKDVDSGGSFFVCTQKEIIKCFHDTTLHVLSRGGIETYTEDTALRCEYVRTIHNSPLWFNSIGTHRYGAWLNFPDGSQFDKLSYSLEGYRMVGQFGDSLYFWIHPEKDILAVSDAAFRTQYVSLLPVTNPLRVVHYMGSKFLICGTISHFYDIVTHQMTPISSEVKSYYDVAMCENGDYYFVGGRGLGKHFSRRGVVVDSILTVDRYDNILRVPAEHKILAYTKSELLIVDESDDSRREIYDRTRLAKLGIFGLENVCVDPQYGNIFLKGSDNIVALDLATGKYRRIFSDLRFKDATDMYVSNGRLLVAWRYGVAAAAMRGRLAISSAFCIPNPKSLKYNRLFGSYVRSNKFYLNTDKGFYSVSLPEYDELNSSSDIGRSDTRMVLSYADTALNITSGDTVVLRSVDRLLSFDVVNPRGNGKLKFYYSMGGENYRELAGGILDLSNLAKPGKYVNMVVYASDDSWRSAPISLWVWVEPLWWQKAEMLPMFVILFILIAGGLVAAIVWITRRVVLRNAERKQARMELELRSIYAQINPHFIFNTLNSALLLISKNRMDEAYNHVSKFSRLLRSYLRSSRNKFTTVAEEALNLRNYIELQQARFRDRFDYDIYVEPHLEQSQFTIPSLLIQPFVENAINHGLLPMEGRGELRVSFVYKREMETVECLIEDNGVGREKSKADKIGRENVKDSYGDLIINDLVRTFNKYEKMNVHVSYFDKRAPEKGTLVSITIKKTHGSR